MWSGQLKNRFSSCASFFYLKIMIFKKIIRGEKTDWVGKELTSQFFPPWKELTSQFFPRGKNGPAHSFPGEKTDWGKN